MLDRYTIPYGPVSANHTVTLTLVNIKKWRTTVCWVILVQSTFEFCEHYALSAHHVQCLKYEQSTVVCIGSKPKQPGSNPAEDSSMKLHL